MWHASWGGYPPAAFLDKLDPRLSALAATLGNETYTAETVFGKLCAEWARRLGLSTEVVVAVGAFDAHIGAVGGDVAPGTLLKIMGTSTCDIMIGARSPTGAARSSCAGSAARSTAPSSRGMIGYEAGQSAFGDVFAWFREAPGLAARAGSALASGRRLDASASELEDKLLPALEAEAAKIDPAASGLVALDWHNGRRTPDADQALTGAIAGISLGTDAPAIYRALIESAAFGSRAIVERLRSEGVEVERVAAMGGVARKSPLVMQIMLGRPRHGHLRVRERPVRARWAAPCSRPRRPGSIPTSSRPRPRCARPSSACTSPIRRRAPSTIELYEKYQALGAFVEKEMRK